MWTSLSRWWDRLQEAEQPLGAAGDASQERPSRHRYVGYRTLRRLHGAAWDRLLKEKQAEIEESIRALLTPLGGWVQSDAHGLVLHFPPDASDEDTLDRQAELARARLFELLSPPPGAILPPEPVTPAPEPARSPPASLTIPPVLSPPATIPAVVPAAVLETPPPERSSGLGGFLSGLKRPDPPSPPKRLPPPAAPQIAATPPTLMVAPVALSPATLIVAAPGEIPLATQIVSAFEGLDPANTAPSAPVAASPLAEAPSIGDSAPLEPETEGEAQVAEVDAVPSETAEPPATPITPGVTLPPRVRRVPVAQIPPGLSFNDLWNDLVGPLVAPPDADVLPAPLEEELIPELPAAEAQIEDSPDPALAEMAPPPADAAPQETVPEITLAPTPATDEPARPRHARVRKVAVAQLPPGLSFADAWRDLVGDEAPAETSPILPTAVELPPEPVPPVPVSPPPAPEPPRRSLDDIWSDLMGAASDDKATAKEPITPPPAPVGTPSPKASAMEDVVRGALSEAPPATATDKPWFGPAYSEQSPLDAATRALHAADEVEMEKIVAAPSFPVRRRRFDVIGDDGIAVGYRSFWGAGNGLVATYLIHPLKMDDSGCRSAYELAEQAQSAKASADLDLLMMDRVGQAIADAIRRGKRFIPILPISKSTLLRHRLRGSYLQRWHAQPEETRTVTRFVVWEVDHSTSRGELQEMAGLLRQFGKPPLIRLNPASTVAGRMQGAGYSYVFYDLAEPHLPEERSWLMQRLPQITAKFRQNNLRVMIGGVDDVPTIKQIFQAKPDLIEAGDITSLDQLPDMPRHLTPPALATQILAEFGRGKTPPPEPQDQTEGP